MCTAFQYQETAGHYFVRVVQERVGDAVDSVESSLGGSNL